MIRSIGLHNFKCFESQQIEFGHLTLLAGLNGTGKSSVLQSLLLLHQSYEQGLLQKKGLALNGNWVQLGTARDVLYESASVGEFGFDLDFDGQSSAWRFAYDVEADVVRMRSKPAPVKIYMEHVFGDDFHYISAERTGPRTSFTTSDFTVRRHRQLGVRGEYAAQFLNLYGHQRVANETLAHPKEAGLSLKAQVEAWMSEVSPGVRIDLIPYADIDLVSLQYSFVTGSQVSNKFRSTNVGFGITYTLPLVIALLASPPGAVVLLENPEAHLHPRGQVQMGELIARVASVGVQVLVETHSDHILNGVRIAVRQGLLAPDLVRIHFFDRREVDGQVSSHVVSPTIDKDGRIDEWPDGFFDEWEKSLEKLL